MCAAERKHNENENENEQKLFDIGKYRFEWHCDVSNEDKLSIIVIETLSRDRFEGVYCMQDLKEMKFFKPNVTDVKHFIQKIIFNKDDVNNKEMFYQIGFIDKDNQCEGYKSLKNDKYTESDKLVIILNYVNEWINSKWELELDYIPQTEDVKVLDIVRDLQYENRKIKQEINFWKYKNSIPLGLIVMWSGDLQNIPKGYLLCDGLNNTPDLRDRFVLGCSNQTKIGSKGGDDRHRHNITVSGRKLQIKHMPSHQHKIQRDYWDIESGGGGNKYRVLCANNNGDRNIWSNYVGSSEEHDHPSYCANASNIPPYVSLAFIMKIY